MKENHKKQQTLRLRSEWPFQSFCKLFGVEAKPKRNKQSPRRGSPHSQGVLICTANAYIWGKNFLHLSTSCHPECNEGSFVHKDISLRSIWRLPSRHSEAKPKNLLRSNNKQSPWRGSPHPERLFACAQSDCSGHPEPERQESQTMPQNKKKPTFWGRCEVFYNSSKAVVKGMWYVCVWRKNWISLAVDYRLSLFNLLSL